MCQVTGSHRPNGKEWNKMAEENTFETLTTNMKRMITTEKFVVAVLEVIHREMVAQRISDQMLARHLHCEEYDLPEMFFEENVKVRTLIDTLDFLGYDLSFQTSKR